MLSMCTHVHDVYYMPLCCTCYLFPRGIVVVLKAGSGFKFVSAHKIRACLWCNTLNWFADSNHVGMVLASKGFWLWPEAGWLVYSQMVSGDRMVHLATACRLMLNKVKDIAALHGNCCCCKAAILFTQCVVLDFFWEQLLPQWSKWLMCHLSPCCFQDFEQLPMYTLVLPHHAAPDSKRHEADEEVCTRTTHSLYCIQQEVWWRQSCVSLHLSGCWWLACKCRLAQTPRGPLPLQQSQGHVSLKKKLHLCFAMVVTMLQHDVAWDCRKKPGSCMLDVCLRKYRHVFIKRLAKSEMADAC